MINYQSGFNIFQQYYSLWIVIAQLYLVFVFNTTFPKTSKFTLITSIWNLSLSIFSLYGMYVIGDFSVHIAQNYGLESMLTQDQLETDYRQNDWIYFWTFLFIVSKIPELIDTVLLKLSGKEPIFLQWFHHVCTMLYAYYLGINTDINNVGLIFALMNYTVHTIMYFYFAIHPYLNRSNPIIRCSFIITIMQTVQMFIALFCFFYNYFVLNHLFDWFGFTMYCIYGILFSQLFFSKISSDKAKKSS